LKLTNDLFHILQRPRYAFAVLIVAVLLAATPQPSNADGIDWTVAPYMWATGVGLDVNINSDPIIGVDAPFNDIVDKLDGAFMGHIEMSGDRFGLFVDAFYVKLADDAVIPVGPGGPILGDLLIDTDLTMKIYELGGFYRMGRPDPGSSAFDILVGVRQVDVNQNLDIVLPGPGATPINRNLDVTETDVFAGARVIGRFSEKWSYRVRADYGGGGTEGTINALAAVGYTFGKTGLFSLEAGYRYLSFELKNDSNGTVAETDLSLSGPLVGFVFKF